MPANVREARLGDAKRIWEMRNAPEVRELSENSEEISFIEHEDWFAKQYFQNGDSRCFVLEWNGQVEGYCRFDSTPEQKNYTISIALAPEMQGKGFGSHFLEESLKLLDSKKPIHAVVLKKNESSLRFFQKNNFQINAEDNAVYTLLKQP